MTDSNKATARTTDVQYMRNRYKAAVKEERRRAAIERRDNPEIKEDNERINKMYEWHLQRATCWVSPKPTETKSYYEKHSSDQALLRLGRQD